MKETPSKKIVLVEAELDPFGESSMTTNLACRLKSEGWEVLVVCNGGPGQQALKIKEIPSIIVPSGRPHWLYWRQWSFLSKIEDFAPDLLHAQSSRLADFVKKLAVRLKRPYILTVNQHITKPKKLPLIRKWLRRVIAVNEDLREELVNIAKVPKEMVRMIPNGVDVSVYRRFLPASMNVKNGSENGSTSHGADDSVKPISLWSDYQPVVGMIAPMVKEKGQEIFLRAAKIVLDQRPEIQFLIAGRGPNGPKLRLLAENLGLTGLITFVDYVDNHLGLLKAIDFFVLPAVQEGYGMTVLEAMACGRPVIVSGVGGLYSLVEDRKSGLIVPRQNAPALAEAILELLQKPELAYELSQKALKTVEEKFSQKVTFQQILTVYEEVCNSTPNGKPV